MRNSNMKKVQLIKAAMKFKNSPRLSVIRALSVKDYIFVNKNPNSHHQYGVMDFTRPNTHVKNDVVPFFKRCEINL